MCWVTYPHTKSTTTYTDENGNVLWIDNVWQRRMRAVEFFAGGRCFGRVAEERGHEVISTDWEPYDGVDIIQDAEWLRPSDFGATPDIAWASFDCTTYTIAACSTHRNMDKSPKTAYAAKCDRVNQHVIAMLDHWLKENPNFIFFMENPRGNLRHMEWMKRFHRHTVWYCQYGDERAKPTDIWTNCNTWTPKPMCRNYKYDKYGEIVDRHCHHESARRGARTGTQGRKGSYERSLIPLDLIHEILDSVEVQHIGVDLSVDFS